MPDLTGRVALVTGAGGGIGAGIVQRLAEDGATVVALDCVFADDGPGHPAVRRLVSDLADAGRLRDDVTGLLADPGAARLSILVNCAGIMRRGDALSLGPSDWADTFRVNTEAVFELCRLVLPHLSAAGGGSVVNIASQWGLHPAAGHVAYNSSKAAVVALSQSLARDHGHLGVRVNAVCPGEILTPMVEQKLRDSGTSEAELASSVPLGRLGRPADVAALVSFLASDEASFISGAAIEITGAQVVA